MSWIDEAIRSGIKDLREHIDMTEKNLIDLAGTCSYRDAFQSEYTKNLGITLCELEDENSYDENVLEWLHDSWECPSISSNTLAEAKAKRTAAQIIFSSVEDAKGSNAEASE